MNNEIESEGATFLGEMYTLDEYDDVNFGYAPVTLVLNKNRELEIW